MASTTKDKLTAAAAGAAIALVVSRYLKKQAPYDATHDEVRAIVRPNIRKLEPYRCARDDYEEGVLLDANENAYGACVKSDEALGEGGSEVRFTPLSLSPSTYCQRSRG